MAPSSGGGGISIPTHENGVNSGSAMVTDDQNWSSANGGGNAERGGGRSPGRERNGDAPRRSRSRSPVRRDNSRGSVHIHYLSTITHFIFFYLFFFFFFCATHSRGGDGGTNPGNNLYVSGISQRVDNRELEAAFQKVGRVCKFREWSFELSSS